MLFAYAKTKAHNISFVVTAQLISALFSLHRYYNPSTSDLNLKFQVSSIRLLFVSELVGNPEDRFPHDAVQVICHA